MPVDPALKDRVFRQIDPEELTQLAVEMGRVLAPIGREKPMADYLMEWLGQNGFAPRRMVAAPERDNVVATLRGTGAGNSLIFNAHTDSDRTPEENIWVTPNPERSYPQAWVEGDKVFGRAVLNDRGSMACFLIAAKALQDSGVKLAGDLILKMVVGETDQAPVDEFQGHEYTGNGVGTDFLLKHGVVADYAVVAETTDFSPVWLECGVAFFKITTYGQAVYTPRTDRPDNVAESHNAVVKMAHLIVALEQWARGYEAANTREYPLGTVVPKVSVNAVRGGMPYRVALSGGVCSTYVDVRILPGRRVQDVESELRTYVESTGLGARVEMYSSRRGYVAQDIEQLLEAVNAAHRDVLGGDPGPSTIEERSMWRDINLYNEWGIPSLTYGPPRRVLTDGVDPKRHAPTTDDGGKVKYFLKEDLESAARIYALTALQICGTA